VTSVALAERLTAACGLRRLLAVCAAAKDFHPSLCREARPRLKNRPCHSMREAQAHRLIRVPGDRDAAPACGPCEQSTAARIPHQSPDRDKPRGGGRPTMGVNTTRGLAANTASASMARKAIDTYAATLLALRLSRAAEPHPARSRPGAEGGGSRGVPAPAAPAKPAYESARPAKVCPRMTRNKTSVYLQPPSRRRLALKLPLAPVYAVPAAGSYAPKASPLKPRCRLTGPLLAGGRLLWRLAVICRASELGAIQLG
jgi:hypothetical protein